MISSIFAFEELRDFADLWLTIFTKCQEKQFCQKDYFTFSSLCISLLFDFFLIFFTNKIVSMNMLSVYSQRSHEISFEIFDFQTFESQHSRIRKFIKFLILDQSSINAIFVKHKEVDERFEFKNVLLASSSK